MSSNSFVSYPIRGYQFILFMEKAMIIAVTGISSSLGKALIPKLQDDPSVERIIGIDVTEYSGNPDKITFIKADVRDMDSVAAALEGADVLFHMAFIVIPPRLPKRKIIYDINVNGSKAVFKAAAKKKVKKIIYLSSVVAYGHRPESPQVVTEKSPLLGSLTTNFYYSHTKGLVEQFLDQFEKDYPDISIIRIRAPMIGDTDHFGKGMSAWRYSGKSSKAIFPLNQDGKLPWQLLLEDDLTEALTMLMKKDVRGAFNVASPYLPDLYTFIKDEYNHELQPRAAGMNNFFLGLQKMFPKLGWIQAWTYTSMMNTEKIEKELNWKPSMDTAQIIRKALGPPA